MEQLRCLYLEDDPLQSKRYASWIDRAWQQMGTYVPISVHPVQSPDEVVPKLKSTPRYHLLIADLLFDKERQPLGLQVIKHAHEEYPDLAIIALSIGNGGLEQKSRDVGADEYISKPYLIE